MSGGRRGWSRVCEVLGGKDMVRYWMDEVVEYMGRSTVFTNQWKVEQ
jgi:hypothetical protein